MTSQFKTFLLFAVLTGIIMAIGGALGGRSGIILAFIIALVMNVGSYWFSDSIVLKMYQAREVSPEEAPMLHMIVDNLAARAGLPKPRVCIIPEQAPNAFATGRDPEHAVVAVTEGILPLLSPEELQGVLGHEMAHIAHRDILIQTIASVMGSVICTLANILQFSAIFGGNRDEEGNSSGGLSAILLAILAPIAATIIQMAISRAREYMADETGAQFCGQPLMLASALNKLQNYSSIPMQNGNAATSALFISAPIFTGGMQNLFSTHPPMEERIARLQEIARSYGQY